MAISGPYIERVSPFQVRFFWSSDLVDPTYYVWIDGAFVGETLETEWFVNVGTNGQVQFSVFDDAAGVPPTYFPNYLVLRWMGRDGAAMYRVEQYVSDSWVLLSLVPFRVSNVYRYKTGPLEDSTTYDFRVVPVDESGRAGVVRSFTVEMVRYPDAPSQTMTFAGGELVLT